MTISDDIHDFLSDRATCRADAVQRVALHLACGIDLPKVLAADRRARQAAIARIDRQIRRERQKGLSRHWSYDLDRHIALKQARDRLEASCAALPTGKE